MFPKLFNSEKMVFQPCLNFEKRSCLDGEKNGVSTVFYSDKKGVTTVYRHLKKKLFRR